VQDENITKKKS